MESFSSVVLANSKLTGFTAVLYFFTRTRDEPFFGGSVWICRNIKLISFKILAVLSQQLLELILRLSELG